MATVNVKVIIEDGVVTGVLSDGDVDVEIVNVDRDYENYNYEILKNYTEKLYHDPGLKEREYTVAF